MPELIITLKGRELQRFPITQRITTIGRGNTNDTNESVSREHAKLSFVNHTFFIEGVSSSNLVLLNGAPCHFASPLEDEDRIQLGKYTLVLNMIGGPSMTLLMSGNFSEIGSTEILSTDDINRYAQSIDQQSASVPRSLEQMRLDKLQRLNVRVKILRICLLFSALLNLYLLLRLD